MDEEYYQDARIDYEYSNEEIIARQNRGQKFAKSIKGLFGHVATSLTDAGMEMSKDTTTPEFNSGLNSPGFNSNSSSLLRRRRR